MRAGFQPVAAPQIDTPE